MSLILNIDSFSNTATISLADNGINIGVFSNSNQKDHAAFMHTAIRDLCRQHSVNLSSLTAVAVINGPGSYTGLRVGMAAAKGLCYALKVPLLTIGSLEMLARAVVSENIKHIKGALYCPLIDARRMEVFTAVFDQKMNKIIEPCNLVLDERSFEQILNEKKVYFFGDGAYKFMEIIHSKNSLFIDVPDHIQALCTLSFEQFKNNQFSELAYSEPFYIKEFYSSPDHFKK